MKTFYYFLAKAILFIAVLSTTNNLFAQTGIKTCAIGYHHNLFIGTTDSLYAFGENTDGQIGNGTNTDVLSPISLGFKVNGVACGYNFSFYIKTDSTVMATGSNVNGELGIGSTTNKNVWTPLSIAGTKKFRQIAASADHAVGVLYNGGQVYAWGANTKGECGDGTTTQRNSPVQVQKKSGGALTGIIKVACGSPDNDANTGGHCLALKSDGTVWAWGLNVSGQLGDGTGGDRDGAVQVTGIGGSGFLTNVIDIAASGSSSFALLSDSTVVAWGDNTQGQLGDGSTTSRRDPRRVKSSILTNMTSVAQISAASAGLGDDFLSMLRSDGKIWNVGANNRGQLGIGSVLNQNYAVKNNPLSSRVYKEVVATGHYQVLLSNDTIGNYCESGHMTNGSFGNGSNLNQLITGASCVAMQVSPLPVTLSAFTVKRTDDKTVVVRWTTETEINNDRFDIEYSTDGREYDVIATIKGNGTSFNTNNYQYIQKNANSKKIGYYRIKQIDFNGDFEYHKTIVVKPGVTAANVYSYPNPTKGFITVNFTEETNTDYSITVMDQMGRVIMEKDGYIQNNPVSEKFDLNGFDNGFYLVTIKTAFGTTTEKVAKQ